MNHEVKYQLSATAKKLTLTLELPNDASSHTWLHDLVAIRIAKPGAFIGDVFSTPVGKRAKKSGTFAPSYLTFEET